MAAGLASGQAMAHTGPPLPPREHPEWQGSVSDKWMDRRNGHHSCRRIVDTHCRDGVASVARLGIGGYAADTSGMHWPEGRYLGSSPEVNPPPPPAVREMQWKPSRRLVVPPHILHRESLESTKLTQKPPYVGRTSATLPKMHPRMQMKRAQSFGELGLDRDIRRIPFWVQREKREADWWDAGLLNPSYGPSKLQTFGNAARKQKLREMTDYWEPRVCIEKGCKYVAPSTKANHDAFMTAMTDSLPQKPVPVMVNRSASATALLGVKPQRPPRKNLSSGHLGPEESVRQLGEGGSPR